AIERLVWQRFVGFEIMHDENVTPYDLRGSLRELEGGKFALNSRVLQDGDLRSADLARLTVREEPLAQISVPRHRIKNLVRCGRVHHVEHMVEQLFAETIDAVLIVFANFIVRSA